ncbi:MAG: hypothetical protein SGARI_002101, partial [Bacillariaceae sp.]
MNEDGHNNGNEGSAVASQAKSSTTTAAAPLPLEVEQSHPDAEEAVAMLKSATGNGEDTLDLSASLTPNTYSILFVANPKSLAFFFGLVFFVFQVTLASLALVDLLDTSSTNNVMKVPAGVPTYVRVAGYLSVVLAVPLFTDLLDSVERMHEGYDKVVMQQAPHATKCKFIMAYSFQFISGALFQVVIFLLIVQSTTVISMLLNFAALSFITEIDDVAFSLAERGYFSMSIKNTCHVVTELKTPNTKGPWMRRIFLLVILVTVLAGYTGIYVRQETGSYLCNRLGVQFGDEILSELPLYSGVYFVDKKKRENDRYVYSDEVSGWNLFRYCRSEGAWVFGYIDIDSVDDETFNLFVEDIDNYYDLICDPVNWLSKSPSTRSFSILDVKPSDWLTASTEDNLLVYPSEHFVMQCLDCSATTCNSLGGTCEYDPDLSEDQVCVCYDGFFGNECQFNVNTTVCDSITYDHRFGPFQEGGIDFATRFDLVVDAEGRFMDFFGKAVYAYTHQENEAGFGWMDVVAYYGRRYFLTEVNWRELFPNATVDTAARMYIEHIRSLREYGWALGFGENETIPFFVSDPLDLGTGRDKLTPTNLN